VHSKETVSPVQRKFASSVISPPKIPIARSPVYNLMRGWSVGSSEQVPSENRDFSIEKQKIR
jgi:hypothetical protein